MIMDGAVFKKDFMGETSSRELGSQSLSQPYNKRTGLVDAIQAAKRRFFGRRFSR
jgi:hypothetical protein